ncbi:hypothetical protein Noda2021_10870 [Candidatus Dependentiae bacterium Noda2021]|nr:hypothetical protein Noda2021_10870 [Candidatus Dependentiae bacterium Noda2021]
MNKHEFALYYPSLSEYVSTNSMSLHITDKDLCHRLGVVLRFQPAQTLVLFDKKIWASVTLVTIDRKSFTAAIHVIHKNKPIQPDVTAIIPLIKKDSLETLFYHLVELGVTRYQLVTSQKTQRAWGGIKEHIRLENIMIAAAEQSKNFYIPQSLGEPVSLEDALSFFNQQSHHYEKIFFDVDGLPLASYVSLHHGKSHNNFLITVGPEGDYTQSEKDMLKSHAFTTVKLTPTVLRSWQAATLGIGVIRSYFTD